MAQAQETTARLTREAVQTIISGIKTNVGMLPRIIVTSDAGSVVTITKGTKTITAEAITSTTWGCNVPEYGTWTVNSTLNGSTASTNVVIDNIKIYNIAISHFSASITVTYPAGAICRCYKGDVSFVATGSPYTFTVGSAGTWTIEVTYDNVVKTSEISITQSGQTESVTINYASIVVTYDNEFKGASLSCSDGTSSYVKTAPSDGNTVTFTVGTTGTWTISGTVSGDTYTDDVLVSAMTSYTADLSVTQIYGAEWDGSSTTAWSRTDAAASFTDPSPAVNNGNGSSPFDTISPWKDMVKETDANAGTLVKIPKYYYKWTRNGSKMKLQISSKSFDGALVSPAHADRGDGKGERDYVYVGRYHCATSTYKSTTGVKPQASVTRANFRTSIHNLGSDIWQNDFAMWWTINMLYLVEYADWNSQAKIGYGCGNNSATENSGLTDAMTYHTGTNAANRTTYGHTQYRYIEDLWGNVWDWCDGIYFSSANVYCIKNPASFSDSSGGTLVGTRATSSGWISGWTTPSATGFEYALYPNAASGSGSTYCPDYCYYNASGVVLCVGGNYYLSQHYGAFYLYGVYQATSSYADIGSRIMKLP